MRSLAHFAPLLLLVGVISAGVLAAYFRGRAGVREAITHSVEEGEGFFRRLVAPDGTRIDLPGPPRRVVALSLAAEEIITALAGIDVLAGVSPFARQPRHSNIATEATAIDATVVGSNAEQIVRLEPDLVLLTSYTERRVRDILERCGVPVFPLPPPRDLESIRKTIELLGQILGRSSRATEILDDLNSRIETLKKRRSTWSAPRVLYLVLDRPGRFWVAGAGTVIGEIIELAGCRNVAAEHGLQGIPALNRESLLRWEPEWLLAEGEDDRNVELADQLAGDPALATLTAVRERKLVVLPARKLSSVSHHVVDAAEMLFEKIHGERP